MDRQRAFKEAEDLDRVGRLSVRALRDRLGSGSLTTLTKLINEYRQTVAEHGREQAAKIIMVRDLHAEESRLTSEILEKIGEIASLQKTLEAATTQLSETQKKIGSLLQ